MFDGIKLLDVSVEVDAFLSNDRLTFAALVDGQTGLILDPTRKAYDRGLTFRLVPRRNGQGHRVEVKGSLHKFHNNGQHNADQFTVNDLLSTLDELAKVYGFDLFRSRINNVEFGVNVELPFPVSQVLKNLVCYKNQPFYLDTHSDTPYYVCQLQRYAVKIYDKGKQRGLAGNLLRFEIRVKKMEYFNGTGIVLTNLADLMNVTNYKLLGALLLDTFNEILFDDPAIKPAKLPPSKQAIYRNGRNPRYWQIPENLTPKEANAYRQRLSRDRRRYRELIEQYSDNWPVEVTRLIGETWSNLTAITTPLLTGINNYLTVWQNLTNHTLLGQPQNETCHELTDSPVLICEEVEKSTCHKLTATSPNDLSQINPLYSGLAHDCNSHSKFTVEQPEQGLTRVVVTCLVTGIGIEFPRPGQRFISAVHLKNLYTCDRPTFDNLAGRFLTAKHAGATLDRQCYYMAHNIRNAYTNRFNNPLRRIKKYQKGKNGQLPLLFSISTAQLNERIQAGIEYRKGTRYEVGF
ncbi:hypothetical protein [Spirosoma panaciterrae]|uniref:hypothetical protein n=1 Tax=Spirosoma panaciterrae TaxID=496058 RepID=UPI000372A20E|nr:hypothetical protein [Spirosoma panaciterrae]